MSTVSNLLASPRSRDHIRPFDIRRDLRQVADLVEGSFYDTLDEDGRRYIRQMRAAAANARYLRWAGAVAERVAMPLSGYVWIEDGLLVGNLSLIPFRSRGRRCYLIANVAVHPDYRRRGIASSLTARAIEHARKRSAQAAWLHVREENLVAVNLYRRLGFVERARRTTWRARGAGGGQPPYSMRRLESDGEPVRIKPRSKSHWDPQKTWLRRVYPNEVTWHMSLKPYALRPGLMSFLYRLFSEGRLRQWSALQNDRLLGVLAWQDTATFSDALWLAAPEESEDMAARVLLEYIRRRMNATHTLTLDYPAGRAVEAIQAAGFDLHQTLIWMEHRF
jgi:ribosomal protein S18 acetylase RimI-like enzyme